MYCEPTALVSTAPLYSIPEANKVKLIVTTLECYYQCTHRQVHEMPMSSMYTVHLHTFPI